MTTIYKIECVGSSFTLSSLGINLRKGGVSVLSQEKWDMTEVQDAIRVGVIRLLNKNNVRDVGRAVRIKPGRPAPISLPPPPSLEDVIRSVVREEIQRLVDGPLSSINTKLDSLSIPPTVASKRSKKEI